MYNKIDVCSIEEVDAIARMPNSTPCSASQQLNMDGLLERMWDMMALVRVYTKKVRHTSMLPLTALNHCVMHPCRLSFLPDRVTASCACETQHCCAATLHVIIGYIHAQALPLQMTGSSYTSCTS